MTVAADDAASLEHTRLREFLIERSLLAANAQVQWQLLSGGKSNLTYFIDTGGEQLVLRRPPLGHVDPRAHDVGREYRILTALFPTGLPVPRPRAECTDATVIGAPFYIMQRVPGRVLSSCAAAPDLSTAQTLSDLVDAVVDGLVALHAIDYQAVGLADLGKPEGFTARQVRRWTEHWRTRQQRAIPALDAVGQRLTTAASRLPIETDAPTIVHNDYNLGNVIVSEGSPVQLRAILDWEMATIGHPLLDVGMLMTYNGPHMNSVLETSDGIACHPSFPSTSDIAARYAHRSGRSIDMLDFFYVLAFFKVLVLTEEVRARFQAGTTRGEGHSTVGRSTPRNAEALFEFTRSSPAFVD